MHQGNTLSHGHGLNLVMGHINKGLMVHLMDFHQLLPGPQPQLGIQVGKWFVQKEIIRALHHCPGQRHPLALAAGKILWPALLQPFQVQHIQNLRKPGLYLRGIHFVGF